MADPRDFWHILPNYVKKDVVHYLDFKTRCKLSYCSKSDLKLVKSTPIAFRNIYFAVVDDALAGIHFNTLNCPKDQLIAAKLNGTQQFINRLCEMLRAPNTCQNLCLRVMYDDEQQEEMKRLIRELKVKNLHPKLKVLECVHIAGDILCDFLTQIDAEYLNGMKVYSLSETNNQVARIVATEQWKKLKVFLNKRSKSVIWLESVLDKPMFLIGVSEMSLNTANRIIKTFQEKNHPVGSCFIVQLYSSYLNVREIFEDPGQRIMISENRAFYLKKFPLADEALELRVQLMLTPAYSDSNMKIDEISGIVVRKDASSHYVNVSDCINNCLYFS